MNLISIKFTTKVKSIRSAQAFTDDHQSIRSAQTHIDEQLKQKKIKKKKISKIQLFIKSSNAVF
jgi:hypothetical protein